MTVTYADVAATLPRDIVESIETSLPCAWSANRIHMWDRHLDQRQYEIPGGFAVQIHEWWECVYCGVATSTHPRMPVVSAPAWNILTADEALRVMG